MDYIGDREKLMTWNDFQNLRKSLMKTVEDIDDILDKMDDMDDVSSDYDYMAYLEFAGRGMHTAKRLERMSMDLAARYDVTPTESIKKGA